MRKYIPKKSDNGRTYLNIGCGSHFFPDWNNIDLIKHKDVLRHDIRKGLPFEDNSIDFAYSSHVLEHMNDEDGEKLLKEINRVLKSGGILRIAVPDLENICREYIHNLEEYRNNPNKNNLLHYQWIRLELLDQLTRRISGGNMRKMLDDETIDRDYIIGRIGDAAVKKSASKNKYENTFKSIIKKILQYITRKNDPERNGELHRTMYDSLSIRSLFEKIGFKTIGVQSFDKSKIVDWDRYNLDKSTVFNNKARKPDSLYFEVQK